MMAIRNKEARTSYNMDEDFMYALALANTIADRHDLCLLRRAVLLPRERTG